MTSNPHDAYQAYLDARHARFSTPESIVFRMVRRATGRVPVACARIVKGNDNEVYAVTTAQGQEFVVRIHRDGEFGLHEEAWALAAAREVGVPAPHVLLVDRLEDQGQSLEYMVQTRVPGRPLAELRPHLTPQEWGRALVQMGSVLGRLHRVHTGGFYRRLQDGRWDFSSWSGLMASAARDRAAERPWLLKAGFSDPDCAFMLRMIERYGREFTCDAPVLCHGDFLPQHVFVDEQGRICGVIDFGDYAGSHPIHDLAVIRMACDAPTVEAIRRGYPASAALDDRFELRLPLHLLMLQVGYLAHHIRIPNHPEVPLYAQGLQATLCELRGLGCS